VKPKWWKSPSTIGLLGATEKLTPTGSSDRLVRWMTWKGGVVTLVALASVAAILAVKLARGHVLPGAGAITAAGIIPAVPPAVVTPQAVEAQIEPIAAPILAPIMAPEVAAPAAGEPTVPEPPRRGSAKERSFRASKPAPVTEPEGADSDGVGAGETANSAALRAAITRVVGNNKGGIKVCYQRALLRDGSLTHGTIRTRIIIGLSGRVKNVSVTGPTAFLALEPCIKDMISRWVFEPNDAEYGTEFSYKFQGNE